MGQPVFGKSAYVPVARKPKKEPAPPTSSLTETIRLAPAGSVFRSVPWDGKAEPGLLTPAVDAVDPLSPARLVFAQIAWSGAAASVPTESTQSVSRVLSTFKWE